MKHCWTSSKLAACLVTLAALCLSARAQGPVSKVWVADNGDGTYKNPVIHADFSDPDAVRVGGDYYMTASSFNAAPGLPVLHSKDLVNWSAVGYAFRRDRKSTRLNSSHANISYA